MPVARFASCPHVHQWILAHKCTDLNSGPTSQKSSSFFGLKTSDIKRKTRKIDLLAKRENCFLVNDVSLTVKQDDLKSVPCFHRVYNSEGHWTIVLVFFCLGVFSDATKSESQTSCACCEGRLKGMNVKRFWVFIMLDLRGAPAVSLARWNDVRMCNLTWNIKPWCTCTLCLFLFSVRS